jgi:hypothetical protein
MALFFGVNFGLADEFLRENPAENLQGKQPSFLVRWLFRKRRTRLG